jgi:hypothetical protein
MFHLIVDLPRSQEDTDRGEDAISRTADMRDTLITTAGLLHLQAWLHGIPSPLGFVPVWQVVPRCCLERAKFKLVVWHVSRRQPFQPQLGQRAAI